MKFDRVPNDTVAFARIKGSYYTDYMQADDIGQGLS